MESQTYIKNVRMTPKKLRFLLGAVKKLSPVEAREALFYTPQKAAKVLYKAINSALSNAKNHLKVDEGSLKFKMMAIEEGQKLKRFRPGGRGTVKPYVKRFAHIKIVLKASEQKKAQVTTPELPATTVKKEEVKKASPALKKTPRRQEPGGQPEVKSKSKK